MEIEIYNKKNFKLLQIPKGAKYPPPRNWTNGNKFIMAPKHNNIAIATGKFSNVIVVDIDKLKENKDKEKYFCGYKAWKIFTKKFGEPNTPKVRTPSGGFHYYFNYNEDHKFPSNHIAMGLFNKKATTIDLRSTNEYIMAPPSKGYTLVDGDFTNISDMPDWLYKYLAGEYEYYIRDKKFYRKARVITEPEDDHQPPENLPTIEELDQILRDIDKEYFTDTPKWFRFMKILKSTYGNPAFPTFVKHSMRAPKEVWSDDFQEHWNQCKINSTIKSIRTFYYWRTQSLEKQADNIIKGRISEPKHKVFFSDIGDPDFKTYDLQFIVDTVAYVINGGNCEIVVKNFCHNDKVVKYNTLNEKSMLKTLKDATGQTQKIYKTAIKEKLIMYKQQNIIPWSPVHRTHVPRGILNTYTGTRAEALRTNSDYDLTKLKPILDHLFIVNCARNEELYEHFLNFLALKMQKPHIKPEQAFIFYGEQGTGKNFILSWICEMIYGPQLADHNGDLDAITGRFNGSIEGKQLIVVNEIKNYAGYTVVDTLKKLITETTQVLERKGKDARVINDYCSYFFCTNNSRPIKLTKNDRRYICSQVNEVYCQNTDYFGKLSEYTTQENAINFYNYLLSRDISNWNPRHIVKTSFRDELIESAKPFEEQFLDCVRTGDDDYSLKHITAQGAWVAQIDFYDLFKEWLRENNHHSIKMPRQTFSKKLSKLNINTSRMTIDGRRTQWYPLKEIMQ